MNSIRLANGNVIVTESNAPLDPITPEELSNEIKTISDIDIADLKAKTDINTIDIAAHQSKIDTNTVSITNINSILSGGVGSSPKGVYSTLSDLTTAFPTGTTGVYIVAATGNWYFWNGTTWTSGGTYQSAGIGKDSVTSAELSSKVRNDYEKSYLNKNLVLTDIPNIGALNPNGGFQTSAGYQASFRYSDKIYLNNISLIDFKSIDKTADFCALCLYDSSDAVIASFGVSKIINPENYSSAVYFRFGISTADKWFCTIHAKSDQKNLLSFLTKQVKTESKTMVSSLSLTGYGLKTDGSYQFSSGYNLWKISDLIPTDNIAKLEYNLVTVNEGVWCGLWLLDEGLNVTHVLGGNGIVDLNSAIYSDVKYYKFGGGNDSTTYLKEMYNNTVSDISNITNDYIDRKLTDAPNDGYIKPDGTIVSSATNIANSNKLPLSNVRRLEFNGLLDTTSTFTGLVLYDSSGTVIFEYPIGKTSGVINIADYPTATDYRFAVGKTDTFTLREFFKNGVIGDMSEQGKQKLTKNKLDNIKLYSYIGNKASSDFSLTNWVYNVTGYYVNSVFDISSPLILQKYFAISKRNAVIDFAVSQNGIAYFGTRPSANELSGNTYNSLISVDFVNNTLNIHGYNDISSIASAVYTSSFTSISNYYTKKYRLLLSYFERKIKVTLIDLDTYATVATVESSLSNVDSAFTPNSGLMHDYYCCFSTGAALRIYRFDVYTLADVTQPTLMIVGDSITEGHGIADSNSFAKLLSNELGNTLISGRRGGGINGVLERFDSEIAPCYPSIVMVTIGTNGGNTYYKLFDLALKIKNIGAELILNTVPMTYNGVDMTAINSIILDVVNRLGLKCCRFDLAMNGTDGNLYFDAVHPNNAGAEKMLARIKQDCPEFFIVY